MRVVFTHQAEDGLEAIGDFIAEDNPRRALTFLQELRDIAQALAQTPEAFPLIPRFAHLRVRRRLHGA